MPNGRLCDSLNVIMEDLTISFCSFLWNPSPPSHDLTFWSTTNSLQLEASESRRVPEMALNDLFTKRKHYSMNFSVPRLIKILFKKSFLDVIFAVLTLVPFFISPANMSVTSYYLVSSSSNYRCIGSSLPAIGGSSTSWCTYVGSYVSSTGKKLFSSSSHFKTFIQFSWIYFHFFVIYLNMEYTACLRKSTFEQQEERELFL